MPMKLDDKKIVGCGLALAAAIVILWNVVLNRFDHCEMQHAKMMDRVLEMTEEVGMLRGRVEFGEEIGPKIDLLLEMQARNGD